MGSQYVDFLERTIERQNNEIAELKLGSKPKWIRAEDAPDVFKKGQKVLFQNTFWDRPEVSYFDPNYDRRSLACKGFFFMLWEWPEGPEINHDLPDRIEP